MVFLLQAFIYLDGFVTSALYCIWLVFLVNSKSVPSYTGIDDEDIEEEFKKLEQEVECERPKCTVSKTGANEPAASESAESLRVAFSTIGLNDGQATALAISDTVVPDRSNESKHPMLESA